MKIAYLLGSLNRGGLETLMMDVFSLAGEASFSMLGIYRRDGNLSSAMHSTGVKLIKLRPGKWHAYLSYLYRLRKLLLSNQADIVHAHQRIDALAARLACIGTPVKVIQTFHGFDFQSGKLEKWMNGVSLLLSHANIFVSSYQKEHYLSLCRPNQSSLHAVVYNGIHFGKLDQAKEIKTIARDAQSTDRLRIGMVGNFVPGRDHYTVCRFLAELSRKSIPFEFRFIGKKDPSHPHLYDDCVRFCRENNLEEQVQFTGPREDVPLLLQQMDAFVYATHHDTFGIAVIEAIAAGIPVFVNDWAVFREVTLNGQYAQLYKTGDIKDLMKKFIDFLDNRHAYRQQAKKNALAVRELYGIGHHIDSLQEVYESVLSN